MRTFAALLATLALIALVATSAEGQGQGRKRQSSDKQTTQKRPKADDKDYNRALATIPDQKYDPWSGVR